MVMMEAGVAGPGSVEALGAMGGSLGHDANCLAWSDQVKKVERGGDFRAVLRLARDSLVHDWSVAWT